MRRQVGLQSALTLVCQHVCGCAGLSVILILYLWGSCIAYLVIIGDSFSPLLALATGICNLQMLKQPVADMLSRITIPWHGWLQLASFVMLPV